MKLFYIFASSDWPTRPYILSVVGIDNETCFLTAKSFKFKCISKQRSHFF